MMLSTHTLTGIVITDLNKVIEEVEAEDHGASNAKIEDDYKSEAEPHPDASEYADSNEDYSISSVLLDHIKRQANFPFDPKLAKENLKVRSLVLFKPPPPLIPPRAMADPQKGNSDNVSEGGRGIGGDLTLGGGEGAIGYGGYGEADVGVQEIDVDRENMSTPSHGVPVDDDAMDVEL